MDNIIKKLYDRQAFSSGKVTIEKEQYNIALGRMDKAEAELLETYPEIGELFTAYQSAQLNLSEIIAYQEFVTGFRAGAQLMQEMLKSTD